ncbi:unnamed protein product [Angiostrongylus costaricensis]|uniref:PUM-HD domain-containing protein n=1 Tax=Angiostrongylus costaricensis TaxID=334426 RepID=A0A0R3PLW8_ANGCS|nr:unnamed protein product [Angiostrongylus costaricensis]
MRVLHFAFASASSNIKSQHTRCIFFILFFTPLLDNMVIDKCVQECSGEEERLLSFKDSCVVIENVFGSSQYGASLFLSGLARLKHRRLLDLLFSGNASRAIETLFYAIHPIKEDKHVEVHLSGSVFFTHWPNLVTITAAFSIPDKMLRTSSLWTWKKTREGVYLLSRFENVHLSLVMQDVIEADNIAKMEKSPALVEKILKKSELRQLWCGKNSSRVWEKLMVSCREEMLYLVWRNIVAKHVLELANHPSANFPLQKFIANVKSLELVTNTCLFSFFLLVALLQCASNHEVLQEPILKELRKFFRASMAKNRCGSHVIQAALRSSSLGDNVKEKLIAAFEDDWESLISDVYGSHVFESIWTCSLYNVKRRQDLMKKLVPIHNDSKFWKFAMLRCDMYLFRKDRKAWVEKMKKSIKEAEH